VSISGIGNFGANDRVMIRFNHPTNAHGTLALN